MNIQTTAIIGMGALGMLYGSHIQQQLGKGSVRFVMDSARYEKHKGGRYTVNGEIQDFILTDCTAAKPADLVIVATKYGGLHAALDVMESSVGENTILMSVINGITSEQVIAQRYGDKNLIYCVAIGMGAIRDGCDLSCANKGHLQIGILKEEQRPALEAVKRFLDAVGLDYSHEEDILHALWNKLMLNVGINQTCMVFATTYGGALQTKQSFDMMSGAMHEVIAVAQKEGVSLTEADYENNIRILRSLKPDGYPSMRQDALAKRKSEVELFAGTIIRLAEKHGIPAPVNRFYYDKIREIEANY